MYIALNLPLHIPLFHLYVYLPICLSVCLSHKRKCKPGQMLPKMKMKADFFCIPVILIRIFLSHHIHLRQHDDITTVQHSRRHCRATTNSDDRPRTSKGRLQLQQTGKNHILPIFFSTSTGNLEANNFQNKL